MTSRPIADAAPLAVRRIAFVGFGLIGGSIAMALRASEREAGRGSAPEPLHLSAWTPNGHGPSRGLAVGLLDAAPGTLESAIAGSELVVLAGPPQAVLAELDDLAGPWRAWLGGALVTDVASTKAAIVDRAAGLGLRFVGGHPMAGRESTGVEAASAALLGGRAWAIVPPGGAAEGDVATIMALAIAAGARPIRLGAAEHDAAVAAISHVPLLAAVALAEAMIADPAWHAGAARELASSGWRDATRLAAGSPAMGAGILATNAAEVAPRLRAMRAAIDRWIAELERAGGPELASLQARLEAARAALREGPV